MRGYYFIWENKLKLGMTQDEIEMLFGVPQKKDEYSAASIWHYDFPGGGKILFNRKCTVLSWEIPNDRSYYQKRASYEEKIDTDESQSTYANSYDKGSNDSKSYEKEKKSENQEENKSEYQEEEYTYNSNQNKAKYSEEQIMAFRLDLRGKVNMQDIKNAYRKRIKEYHPDRVANLGKKLQELAQNESREIIEAYDYFMNKYGNK